MKIKQEEIWIKEELLKDDHLANYVKNLNLRVAILLDESLKLKAGRPFLNYFKTHNIPCMLFTTKAGDNHKNLEAAALIYEQLFQHKFGKETALLAVGGGVISDLGGFIASTYLRGIPYFICPTTLMGMVDASIGGKSALNLNSGKNIIGTLYPAKAVFIDPHFLKTLPEEELLSGFFEVIKIALVQDRSLFKKIPFYRDAVKRKEIAILKIMIEKAALLKRRVVAKSKKLDGFRDILNFGHTMGHAIEGALDFKISHGEAIRIGMEMEAFLSFRLNLLKRGEFLLISKSLVGKKMALNGSLRKKFLDLIIRDKKNRGAYPQPQPHFVLLKGIGKVFEESGAFSHPVPFPLIKEALQWFL